MAIGSEDSSLDRDSPNNTNSSPTRRVSISVHELLNPMSPEHKGKEVFDEEVIIRAEPHEDSDTVMMILPVPMSPEQKGKDVFGEEVVIHAEPQEQSNSTMMLLPLRNRIPLEDEDVVKRHEKSIESSNDSGVELSKLFESAASTCTKDLSPIPSFTRYRLRALKIPSTKYFSKEQVAEQYRKIIQAAIDSDVFNFVDWDKTDIPQVMLMRSFFNSLLEGHEHGLPKIRGGYRGIMDKILGREYLASGWDVVEMAFDHLISLVLSGSVHDSDGKEGYSRDYHAALVETTNKEVSPDDILRPRKRREENGSPSFLLHDEGPRGRSRKPRGRSETKKDIVAVNEKIATEASVAQLHDFHDEEPRGRSEKHRGRSEKKKDIVALNETIAKEAPMTWALPYRPRTTPIRSPKKSDARTSPYKSSPKISVRERRDSSISPSSLKLERRGSFSTIGSMKTQGRSSFSTDGSSHSGQDNKDKETDAAIAEKEKRGSFSTIGSNEMETYYSNAESVISRAISRAEFLALPSHPRQSLCFRIPEAYREQLWRIVALRCRTSSIKLYKAVRLALRFKCCYDSGFIPVKVVCYGMDMINENIVALKGLHPDARLWGFEIVPSESME